MQFQSTLPVWGATTAQKSEIDAEIISIHAPRVGSDADRHIVQIGRGISIHAPRVGSDDGCDSSLFGLDLISIHAPRVGSDSTTCTNVGASTDFNPRSPCGERRLSTFPRIG